MGMQYKKIAENYFVNTSDTSSAASDELKRDYNIKHCRTYSDDRKRLWDFHFAESWGRVAELEEANI